MTVPVVSLTLTRTLLSLGTLVINNDSTQTMYLPEDGIVRPNMDYRRTYAQSSYVPGQDLLDAVLEASTLPATIYLHAASTSALRTAEAVLKAALGQWTYTVTLTVDGQTESWYGDPTTPVFGEVESGLTRAFRSRAVLAIPINP